MTGWKWTVRWGPLTANTYLYGSTVQNGEKKAVYFENRLMPPGTVLHRWFSKTNFQRDHIEPAVPLIDGETEYEITYRMEYPRGGRCILRLEFFDRFGEHAGSQLIRESGTRFRCPLKTFSYEMQLISVGAESVWFHSVTISEITESDE